MFCLGLKSSVRAGDHGDNGDHDDHDHSDDSDHDDHGDHGELISRVASVNAPGWVSGLTYHQRLRMTRAGIRGMQQHDCQTIYPCNT